MTPRMITILLHYYVHINVRDFCDDHNNKGYQIEDAVTDLVAAELLLDLKATDQDPCNFRISDKGKAYCQHVLATKMPIKKQIWVVPV